MTENKGFWYADWSFPIFVGLLSAGVFAGIHPFQKRHRRRLAAVDVIVAQRDLGKANESAVQPPRHKRGVVRRSQYFAHLRAVFFRRAGRPQCRAQRQPGVEVVVVAVDDHAGPL